MSDHLDQLIRQAASAHLALAPSRVLTTGGLSGDHDDDDLVARALARLDDPDYVAQLAPFDPEALMMSESDHDPDRDRHGLAPTSAASGDDSGLHDIRALAQTAKIRISRKMPTVTDADEENWASSTGQLKAIALPEPAKMMMLPDLPASPDAALAKVTALKVEARGAGVGATAAAAELTALDAARPRKRTGLWLGLGAGVAAAAAVVVVVATGGGSDKKKTDDSAAVATAPAAPPPAPQAAPSIESLGAPTATAAAAPGGASGAPADPAATPPTVARADVAAVAGGEPKHEAGPKEPRGAGSGSGSAVDGRATKPAAGAGSGAGSGKEPKLVTEPKPADKLPAGEGKKPGGGTAANNGEKSIDDLLGDATGGSKPPPAGGGAAVPKPDKKSLDGKDIKAGMGAVAGKAQACFDQHGVSGYVKVKASVDPSGKVIKVDAVGDFAGSPTGACVAAAVKAGASFPAWDGSQMTINYGYTLNE